MKLRILANFDIVNKLTFTPYIRSTFFYMYPVNKGKKNRCLRKEISTRVNKHYSPQKHAKPLTSHF